MTHHFVLYVLYIDSTQPGSFFYLLFSSSPFFAFSSGTFLATRGGELSIWSHSEVKVSGMFGLRRMIGRRMEIQSTKPEKKSYLSFYLSINQFIHLSVYPHSFVHFCEQEFYFQKYSPGSMSMCPWARHSTPNCSRNHAYGVWMLVSGDGQMAAISVWMGE